MDLVKTTVSAPTWAHLDNLRLGKWGEYFALAPEIDRMRGRLSSVAAMVREPTRAAPRRLPGRNEPCWCGSGKKFKKCHGSPV